MDQFEKSTHLTYFISNELVKEILFISTVVLLTIWFQNRKKKILDFPDGPRGFPFLGHFYLFGSNNVLKLHELGKRYGGMFSLQLGHKKILVLANYSSIKEAFGKQAFQGRPEHGIFNITAQDTGFVDVNGEKWTEQRTFCQKAIQSLTFTNTGTEVFLSDEISHLLEKIQDRGGKPFPIETILLRSVGSCMWALMSGRRCDYNDPFLKDIDKSIMAIDASSESLTFFKHLPFGKWLRRFSQTYTDGVKEQIFLYKLFRKEIAHCERDMEEDELQSFIHSYLKKLQNNGQEAGSSFTRESLVGNLWLHYSAGRDTLGSTLHWCILVIAKFKDIQEKVHQEIDDVIGSERMPTWSDRHVLPYTRAVLSEIQRWRTVMSLNLYRSTTADVNFRGFTIPKGTNVLAVLYSAHHDSEYWTNPEEFQPERFLSEDGKTFLTKEALIPFSFGKRACPAKAFASIMLFVYFSSILQKFLIQLADDKDLDLDGDRVISYAPKSCKTSFLLRSR